jgi:hypothetical protein
MNGNIYSLDNRRLYAFQEAGVDIPYEYASPTQINKAWDAKLTTRNDGTNIRVRGGR